MTLIRKLPEVAADARVRAASLEAAAAGAEQAAGRLASPSLRALLAEANRAAEVLRELVPFGEVR